MRLHAHKEYIDTEDDVKYYQIYKGNIRMAEYVAEDHANALIDGYNMSVDKHNKDILIKRQLKRNKK